ncbi:MAG TPA: ACT domain-containing protein [Methylomirabilota bacterium]|nr:ACT domain-containing protein [Methylomirabilota bacterium]
MPKLTQLVLTLRSQPGVLAGVARALADAGVNITALCASDAAGRGKIRILTRNVAQARRALRAAGYRPTEEPAFVVRLANKPGTLARTAEKVAKARINIRSAYATAAGRSSIVVMTVGSPARARKVLR